MAGQRPNIHWFMSDLRKNGFAEAFKKHADDDVLMSVYVPPESFDAWHALYTERLSPAEVDKYKTVLKTHPIELRIRRNDEERTMLFQGDESRPCPPWCT